MNTHSGTFPGKKVRVKMRNGDVFIAKFDRTEGKIWILRDLETDKPFEVRRDKALSLSIYRATPEAAK